MILVLSISFVGSIVLLLLDVGFDRPERKAATEVGKKLTIPVSSDSEGMELIVLASTGSAASYLPLNCALRAVEEEGVVEVVSVKCFSMHAARACNDTNKLFSRYL